MAIITILLTSWNSANSGEKVQIQTLVNGHQSKISLTRRPTNFIPKDSSGFKSTADARNLF